MRLRYSYTVQMINGNGLTDTMQVEVNEASERAAMANAEFVSATCPLAAWHETPWRAVSAHRAPGAWMWTS